jgi:hypothetical protein
MFFKSEDILYSYRATILERATANKLVPNLKDRLSTQIDDLSIASWQEFKYVLQKVTNQANTPKSEFYGRTDSSISFFEAMNYGLDFLDWLTRNFFINDDKSEESRLETEMIFYKIWLVTFNIKNKKFGFVGYLDESDLVYDVNLFINGLTIEFLKIFNELVLKSKTNDWLKEHFATAILTIKKSLVESKLDLYTSRINEANKSCINFFQEYLEYIVKDDELKRHNSHDIKITSDKKVKGLLHIWRGSEMEFNKLVDILLKERYIEKVEKDKRPKWVKSNNGKTGANYYCALIKALIDAEKILISDINNSKILFELTVETFIIQFGSDPLKQQDIMQADNRKVKIFAEIISTL